MKREFPAQSYMHQQRRKIDPEKEEENVLERIILNFIDNDNNYSTKILNFSLNMTMIKAIKKRKINESYM